MRTLHAVTRNPVTGEIVSAWMAPGSLTVNYRYGTFSAAAPDRVAWWAVQTWPTSGDGLLTGPVRTPEEALRRDWQEVATHPASTVVTHV